MYTCIYRLFAVFTIVKFELSGALTNDQFTKIISQFTLPAFEPCLLKHWSPHPPLNTTAIKPVHASLLYPQIKVAAKFGPNSYVELKAPAEVSESTPISSFSFYFTTQANDGLLYYVGGPAAGVWTHFNLLFKVVTQKIFTTTDNNWQIIYGWNVFPLKNTKNLLKNHTDIMERRFIYIVAAQYELILSRVQWHKM